VEEAVCVVIPALDEEDAIGAVVAGARAHADRVLVVDNGSVDATARRAAAAGACVVSEPRGGYGSACVAGALAAPAGSVLVFSDGDGSDDPAALRRLAAPVLADRADLVLGSRVLGRREPGALRPHQRAGNRLFSWLIRTFWRVPVTDLGPMRAVRRERLLALEIQSRTYGWPVEVVLKAARSGLRVAEVPVDVRRRVAGRSKVSGSLRASLRAGVCFTAAVARYGLGPLRLSPAAPGRSRKEPV
jgi:glycosyltransferase involved in cell wall biosynthesis